MGWPRWRHVLGMAALHSAVVLGVFGWALHHEGLAVARSMAFSTFVFGVLLRAFAARSFDKLLWEVGALSNLKLLAVLVVSVGLQLGIQLLSPTRELFSMVPPTLHHLAIRFGLGVVPVSAVEIGKLVRRWWRRRGEATPRGARARPGRPTPDTAPGG